MSSTVRVGVVRINDTPQRITNTRGPPAYAPHMGSSVLLIVLAVLWAVVLIPILLSRHDSTDETKQVARFRRAMAQLSRGERSPDLLRTRQHEVVRAAATRRRRITLALLGVVAVSLVATFLGYVPVLLLLVPFAMFFGWLALAIRAALTIPVHPVRTVRQRPAVSTPRPRYVTPSATWSSTATSELVDVDEVEFSEQYLGATGTDSGSGSWAPVPVPIPRNVRASGVSGEIIARASSWSKSVLDDVRARTNPIPPTRTRRDDEMPDVVVRPPQQPAQPATPAADFFDQTRYSDDSDIRRAAGA